MGITKSYRRLTFLHETMAPCRHCGASLSLPPTPSLGLAAIRAASGVAHALVEVIFFLAPSSLYFGLGSYHVPLVSCGVIGCVFRQYGVLILRFCLCVSMLLPLVACGSCSILAPLACGACASSSRVRGLWWWQPTTAFDSKIRWLIPCTRSTCIVLSECGPNLRAVWF